MQSFQRLIDGLKLQLGLRCRAVLNRSIRLANHAVGVATTFTTDRVAGPLIAFAAGVLRLLAADTPAYSGINLTRYYEYKKKCCETLQHKPIEICNLLRFLSMNRLAGDISEKTYTGSIMDSPSSSSSAYSFPCATSLRSVSLDHWHASPPA